MSNSFGRVATNPRGCRAGIWESVGNPPTLDKASLHKYTSTMETALPKRNNRTTHWQVREQGHELLRRNVIEAASRLLVEEGPDALTVRRIAQELECSTKIIYTMFQGKEGLADALYLEGCEQLGQRVGRVDYAQRISNPAAYLYEVAWAYWAFALAYPSHYKVMFCGAIPNFHPSSTSIQSTEAVFEALVVNIRQYMEQGLLQHSDDPYIVAKALWAPLHGVVSFYLLGHFVSVEDAKKVFERTVQALIVFIVPDPPLL